jgi:hypothetical protein
MHSYLVKKAWDKTVVCLDIVNQAQLRSHLKIGAEPNQQKVVLTKNMMDNLRAVAQADSRLLPTAAGSGHMGFVVDKAALGQFPSSTSVSLANHSTHYSTFIIIHHLGLVQ